MRRILQSYIFLLMLVSILISGCNTNEVKNLRNDLNDVKKVAAESKQMAEESKQIADQSQIELQKSKRELQELKDTNLKNNSKYSYLYSYFKIVSTWVLLLFGAGLLIRGMMRRIMSSKFKK